MSTPGILLLAIAVGYGACLPFLAHSNIVWRRATGSTDLAGWVLFSLGTAVAVFSGVGGLTLLAAAV